MGLAAPYTPTTAVRYWGLTVIPQLAWCPYLVNMRTKYTKNSGMHSPSWHALQFWRKFASDVMKTDQIWPGYSLGTQLALVAVRNQPRCCFVQHNVTSSKCSLLGKAFDILSETGHDCVFRDPSVGKYRPQYQCNKPKTSILEGICNKKWNTGRVFPAEWFHTSTTLGILSAKIANVP